MFKILHFADAHANSNIDKFTKSIDEIYSYLRKNKIDLILFCDDLFDSVVDADEEYYYIVEKFAGLADYAPIIMGYGTPSHDYKGSLDVFKLIKKKYPIKVVDKDNFDWVFCLVKNNGKFDILHEIHIENTLNFNKDEREYLNIFHLPWPLRYNFLSSEELFLPLGEQEKIFQFKLKKWCDDRKIFTKNCIAPVIFTAHLQLEGSIPTFKQDLYSDTHTLKMFANVGDIGLGGHIHKAQELIHNSWHFWYSGSIFNKSWNEMENKYFNIVTVNDKKDIKVEKIQFNTPLLVKVDLENYSQYENFKSVLFDKDVKPKSKNISMWIRLDLADKNILDVEAEKVYWQKLISEIRIDINYIKDHSMKRSSIASGQQGKVLSERFVTWAKDAKNIEPNEYQIQKIKDLERL